MTTILKAADAETFTLPNTGGTAIPKVGPDVAVCFAPADTEINSPPSWGPAHSLKCPAGTAHIAQNAEGDAYPNLEFGAFYEIGDVLDDTDPRAAYLKAFWAERGHPAIEVKVARKTRPATIVGVVQQSAVGQTFENHEGTALITDGARVLQSPDDASVRWLISAAVYAKKYQA